jgi:hypothetical protein
MIDEDLQDQRVIALLSKLKALKVKTTFECGFAQGTEDKTLVRATGENGLLLTADKNTIDERKYKPCCHGGIIIVKHKRPTPDELYRRLKAFCQSGKRSLAKNHVTHLYGDRAVIHTHHQDPITVTYKK